MKSKSMPKGMPPKGTHMMPGGIPMSDKDMDKLMEQKGGKKGKK